MMTAFGVRGEDAQHRNQRRISWIVVLGLAVFVFLLGLMGLGIISPFFQLISLAAAILVILSIPILVRRHTDWFSIWNFVFYGAILGVFMRSIYITLDYPSPAAIQRAFLLGEPKEFLLQPAIVVMSGVLALTLGYLAGPRRSRKIPLRIFQAFAWNNRRLVGTASLMLIISWIGLFLLVTKTVGHLTMENFSAIRGVSTELSEARGYGYLRWMCDLARLGSLLVFAGIVSSKRRRGRYLILLFLSVSTFAFFGMFVSSRGAIVGLLVELLAIAYYLSSRKLNPVKLMSTGVIAILFVRLLTKLREGYSLLESLPFEFNIVQYIQPAILTTNSIDISKTAHIMRAIPGLLEYQWGRTLLTVFFAWIPRSLWPDKPVVNVDNVIGMVVYGSKTYGSGGVPVGFIAEMYWNFSYPGIVLGCFIAGYVLKVLYTTFRGYAHNRNVVLLYVVSCMQLGASLLGSSFTSVVVGTLTSFLPLYVALSIITESGLR